LTGALLVFLMTRLSRGTGEAGANRTAASWR
jgi:hypothetical protein